MDGILSSDQLFSPDEIKTKTNTLIIGREITYYEKIDSTNKAAIDLANNGAKEGALIIADEQTKGRGRLKRSWISSPRENILMSLLLRPAVPLNRSFYLTMTASIALVEAIKRTTGINALIKWPNDIYCSNKKLAGILTELSVYGNKMNYAVIGIGLNVNSDMSAYAGIENIATSLFMECGEKISRTELLCSILEAMETYYLQLTHNKFANLKKQWENHSLITGKHVTVSSYDYSESGIAESLADDGSLVLITADNKKKNITAGDVSLRLAE